MTKDFNVKLTVRNARLLNAIRASWPSVAAFSRAAALNQGTVNALVCLRLRPITTLRSEWTGLARSVAAALGMYPDELWPEHIRDLRAKRATAEIEISADEIKELASPGGSREARKLISKWSEGLTPRHAKAVAMFAEGATLDEMGQELNVSRERARQIYMKGLRTLKRRAKLDSRVNELSDIEGYDGDG